MRRLLVVLVAMLAACSSGGSGASSSSSTSTTASTTSTTVQSSTVAQVASVIAEKGGVVRADIAKEDACTDIECSFGSNLIARWTVIVADVRLAQSALDATQPWPAEVSDLAQRTSAAFGDVGTANVKWHNCLAAHNGGSVSDCATEQTALERAFRALPTLLDGWEPFGA